MYISQKQTDQYWLLECHEQDIFSNVPRFLNLLEEASCFGERNS